MQKLLNTDPKLFATFEEANSVAKLLRRGELDDWTYEISNHFGSHDYAIAVFDETGEGVGYWPED